MSDASSPCCINDSFIINSKHVSSSTLQHYHKIQELSDLTHFKVLSYCYYRWQSYHDTALKISKPNASILNTYHQWIVYEVLSPISYRRTNKFSSIFNHLEFGNLDYSQYIFLNNYTKLKERISSPCPLLYVDGLQICQIHEFLISLEHWNCKDKKEELTTT